MPAGYAIRQARARHGADAAWLRAQVMRRRYKAAEGTRGSMHREERKRRCGAPASQHAMLLRRSILQRRARPRRAPFTPRRQSLMKREWRMPFVRTPFHQRHAMFHARARALLRARCAAARVARALVATPERCARALRRPRHAIRTARNRENGRRGTLRSTVMKVVAARRRPRTYEMATALPARPVARAPQQRRCAAEGQHDELVGAHVVTRATRRKCLIPRTLPVRRTPRHRVRLVGSAIRRAARRVARRPRCAQQQLTRNVAQRRATAQRQHEVARRSQRHARAGVPRNIQKYEYAKRGEI